MQLNELKSPAGSRHRKKVVGRGRGSGHGKTSCRGDKGARSRAGRWSVGAGEGGQMRLISRLPKMGFNNPNPTLHQLVNVEKLECFDKGTVITPEVLKKQGFISSLNKACKILGDGEVKKSFVIKGISVSKTAKEKIEKAGGTVELVETHRDTSEKKVKAVKKS